MILLMFVTMLSSIFVFDFHPFGTSLSHLYIFIAVLSKLARIPFNLTWLPRTISLSTLPFFLQPTEGPNSSFKLVFRSAIAEFVAALFYTYIGTGAVIHSNTDLNVALAHGFAAYVKKNHLQTSQNFLKRIKHAAF